MKQITAIPTRSLLIPLNQITQSDTSSFVNQQSSHYQKKRQINLVDRLFPSSFWMILVTLGVLQQRSLSLSFSYTTSSSRHWLSKSSLISRSSTTAIASSSNSINMAPTTTNQPRGKIIFHWFRHGDLRLHDNVPLKHSCQLAIDMKKKGNNNVILLPIFNFDDNMIFGNDLKTPSGELKCGPKRTKFIIECIQDLQTNLYTNYQIPLLITQGEPSKVFTSIIQTIQKSTSNIDYDYIIVCQEEVVKEEKGSCKNVLSAIKTLVGSSHCKLQSIWGSTMYELGDLPYEKGLTNMPDTFTPFRNQVEKKCKIPTAINAPTKTELHHLPNKDKDTIEYEIVQSIINQYKLIPTYKQLGYTEEQMKDSVYDQRGVMEFIGGETNGIQRIHDYIWKDDCLKDYFDTRNGMIGANYSTKFSPWLAHGCISSRYIVKQVQKYEQQRISNKSTYWVIFELLWRDYCKFFAYKYENEIFYPAGTTGRNVHWEYNEKYIHAWKMGMTGYPLVDANMRELIATGFMSNRGRQNVASFISIDLQQDWRIGGNYFESYLLDYDVYSNWVVSFNFSHIMIILKFMSKKSFIFHMLNTLNSFYLFLSIFSSS